VHLAGFQDGEEVLEPDVAEVGGQVRAGEVGDQQDRHSLARQRLAEVGGLATACAADHQDGYCGLSVRGRTGPSDRRYRLAEYAR
jgi:hypothetical protein